MSIFILAIGVIFCFFPFTQIIRIESYTQPYALAFCALGAMASFDYLTREFPRGQALLFFSLAMLGTLVFAVTCLPSPLPAEFKSLLAYLSPIIFCAAGFALARQAPILTYRLAAISAVIWIAVGIVQSVVSPSFATQFVGGWEETAEGAVDSGRGTLGLAPEPTHFGFHMLVLASALVILRQRKIILPAACVLTALLIARSSSALLAIVLGSILYLAVFTRRARIFLAASVPAYFLVQIIIDSGFLPDSIRVVKLLKLFFEDPTYLLMADASVNARIGGVIVGAKEILRNYLLPYGMANKEWLNAIGPILARNPWLYDLSTVGVPSGILIIVYQCGIFGLLVMAFLTKRMFSNHETHVQRWFMSVLFFVFMSQYSISIPGYGLVYGFLLAVQQGRAGARGRASVSLRLPAKRFGLQSASSPVIRVPVA